MLRLVAGTRPPTPTSVVVLVPDAAGRLPGRGAWIHPTRACLQQAARRRAFGRALRLTQGVDLEQVRAYVEALEVEHERDASRDDRPGSRHDHRRGVGGALKRTESGLDADESPMSTQQ